MNWQKILLLAFTQFVFGIASAGEPGASCPPALDLKGFPEDVRSYLAPGGDFSEASRICFERLGQATGTPLPALELVRADGTKSRYTEIAKGPSALVLLPMVNPQLTLEWLTHFKKTGWRTASGREVYFLIESGAPEKLAKRVMQSTRAFRFERPLPGFLAYAYVLPLALLVSANFVYEGNTGNWAQM